MRNLFKLSNRILTKEIFQELKELVKRITLSQEEYAEKYGKNKSIQSDSIKRKERIKNIDVELENWINLRSNSEKMTTELTERKNKLQVELTENQKNPVLNQQIYSRFGLSKEVD